MKTWILAFCLGSLAWAQTELVVEASPPEALIFVNRELKGSGKVSLPELPAGEYLLRVSAGQEWESHVETIRLDTQPLHRKIQLRPGAARWLRQGRQALRYSDWPEAIHCFQQAAPTRPVPAAWFEGVAHWKAGQPQLALEALRRYAHYQPEVAQLHWLLGQVQEQLDQPGQAFTAYKKAALLLPDLARALDNLPPVSDAAIAGLRQRGGAHDRLQLAQLLMLKGRLSEACYLVKGLLGGRLEKDWINWDPPTPDQPAPALAPPEDQVL